MSTRHAQKSTSCHWRRAGKCWIIVKRDKETQQPRELWGEARPPHSTQYAPASVGASARTRTPEQCSVGDRRPESNQFATQDCVCLAGMLMSNYCTFSLGEDEMTLFPPKTTKLQHLWCPGLTITSLEKNLREKHTKTCSSSRPERGLLFCVSTHLVKW